MCPVSGHSIAISVKALKTPNVFLIDPERVLPNIVYVFVITGAAGQQPKFYVIGGADLLSNEKKLFGRYGREYMTKDGTTHGRGVGYKELAPYIDNWRTLEKPG
jgi:hypothetical protein